MTPFDFPASRLKQGLSAAEELVTAGILISAEPIRFCAQAGSAGDLQAACTSRTTLTFTARQRNCSSAKKGATGSHRRPSARIGGRHTNNGHRRFSTVQDGRPPGRGATATAGALPAPRPLTSRTQSSRPPEFSLISGWPKQRRASRRRSNRFEDALRPCDRLVRIVPTRCIRLARPSSPSGVTPMQPQHFAAGTELFDGGERASPHAV